MTPVEAGPNRKEDNGRTRFTLRVPDDIHARLSVVADVTGRTLNTVAVEALAIYVTENRGLWQHAPVQELIDKYLAGDPPKVVRHRPSL